MNLELGSYWKHRNGRDAFIQIQGVQDSGHLRVLWLVQGVDKYWEAKDRDTDCTVLTSLILLPDQTEWEPYEPRGTYS